jgi:hypothetical protein
MIYVTESVVLSHDASGVTVLLTFSDGTAYTAIVPNERVPVYAGIVTEVAT